MEYGKKDDRNKSTRNKRPEGYGKPVKYGKSAKTEKSENYRKSVRIRKDTPTDADEGPGDIIEGRNPVLEAIKAGREINKLLVARGEREGSIRQIIYIAKEKGIVIQEVERSALDRLSLSHSHQGIIARVSPIPYTEIEDMLEKIYADNEKPFLILLDGIYDSHNLGSIIRTADAAGAHGVVIPKRRAAGLDSVVAKASSGAVEHVPVARVTNISQTIDYLKEKNIWVVGTCLEAEKVYYESDLSGPVAIVTGSEDMGISRLVREKCDFTVNIPMRGKISSLNASVAAALVMYEVMRQRGKS